MRLKSGAPPAHLWQKRARLFSHPAHLIIYDCIGKGFTLSLIYKLSKGTELILLSPEPDTEVPTRTFSGNIQRNFPVSISRSLQSLISVDEKGGFAGTENEVRNN